jgi:hypothetical protein
LRREFRLKPLIFEGEDGYGSSTAAGGEPIGIGKTLKREANAERQPFFDSTID